MANSFRGEVPIKIGGKGRTLRLGQNEIADLEDALGGRSVLTILRTGDIGVRFVRAAIAIGVRHEARVSVERVGAWMDEEPERFGEFVSIILKAVLLALKGPAAVEEAERIEREAESDGKGASADDPPTIEAGTGRLASEPLPASA
jgi:hypothetical protein